MMDNEIVCGDALEEGYEWRIKELKAMCISEDMLRSEWCLDCQNVSMLDRRMAKTCPNRLKWIGKILLKIPSVVD